MVLFLNDKLFNLYSKPACGHTMQRNRSLFTHKTERQGTAVNLATVIPHVHLQKLYK